MEIVDQIFSESIRVKSHEVDSFNKAHPLYYFQLMQEVAGCHAYQRDMGIPQLLKKGKTWVVTRTKMRFYDYVEWPGSITVETWPQKPWKFYFPRVCRAFDSDKTLLFESLSHWVVVDTSTGRPVKPENFPFMEIPKNEPVIIDPDLGKRVQFNNSQDSTLIEYHPQILYCDIDLNLHVNNVAYLQWILDSLCFSFRDEYKLQEVDITYIAQAFRDDKLVIYSNKLENEESVTFSHQVNRLDQDNETTQLCNAETKWIKKTQ
ncbi:MAG: acyl-ACP thioesterase domain-containing protein [Sphaerochaetaceae bacterium]|nr:hypothetical protein [Candidatus Cloacimonadota bacterium]